MIVSKNYYDVFSKPYEKENSPYGIRKITIKSKNLKSS